jgi:YidC/Oxa1 family membrane protein insertase
LAIIAVAIVSRIIMIPLTNKQLKMVEQNKEFKDEYDKIKKKYKNNSEKQKEALAKMQMKYLPSQIGGCVPLIISLIVLIQVRNAVVNLINEGGEAFNQVRYFFVAPFPPGEEINLMFLGIDLSKVAADISLDDWHIIGYIILAFLVGISQFFSSKILMGMRAKKESEKDKEKDKKADTKKDKGKDGEPDMSAIMERLNKQMIYLFPIMTVFFALGFSGRDANGLATFPSAIALFWFVQSIALVLQEVIINRKSVLATFKSKFNKNGKNTTDK